MSTGIGEGIAMAPGSGRASVWLIETEENNPGRLFSVSGNTCKVYARYPQKKWNKKILSIAQEDYQMNL